MFKKLIVITTALAASYFLLKKVEESRKDLVKVKQIPTKDILEMFKEKNFKILNGYDDKVLHFIKDDKSEAIQARLNDENQVFLIEYYCEKDGNKSLENVYPAGVVLDNDSADKARKSFLRLLGSIGVTEKRFNDLVKEVLQDKSLADLTI